VSSRTMRVGLTAVAFTMAAGLWWQRTAQAQTGFADVQWEYLTVEELEQYNIGNARFNSANICYHTVNGCRWDTLRVTTARWSQTNDAVAAAIARLGLQGWELVATTPPNEIDRMSVMMKRVRRPNMADAPPLQSEP
jgi:hypothetical protein